MTVQREREKKRKFEARRKEEGWRHVRVHLPPELLDILDAQGRPGQPRGQKLKALLIEKIEQASIQEGV